MADNITLADPTSVAGPTVVRKKPVQSGAVAVYGPFRSSVTFLDFSIVLTSTGLGEREAERMANIGVIEELAKLPKGWDGYGAPPIPVSVINRAIDLLNRLPNRGLEVFPTGRRSVQFEYDFPSHSIEIEIQTDTYLLLKTGSGGDQEWSTDSIEDVIAAVDDAASRDR